MKICFWGELSEALLGNTPGGGELQIALLAKSLATIGNKVVVFDYTISNNFTTKEGVEVKSLKGWYRGIKGLRNITHRIPILYKELVLQKADYYYCRMRDYRHLIVYIAARKVGAKFVYGLAQDLESLSFSLRCRFDYFTNTGGLWWLFNIFATEVVHYYFLQKSDIIYVQHSGQRNNLLRKNINSIVFPNLIEEKYNYCSIDKEKKDFIYVGTLAKNKGVIELFSIIRSTPSINYKIIGIPRDRIGKKFYKKLQSLENTKLYGHLDHDKTIEEIRNSQGLILTSKYEGFPNVLLEAWSCCTPVYSLFVNPGNVLVSENLGYFAFGKISDLIKNINNNPPNSDFSFVASKYLEAHHLINKNKLDEINLLFS